jgi:hypothetical protein
MVEAAALESSPTWTPVAASGLLPCPWPRVHRNAASSTVALDHRAVRPGSRSRHANGSRPISGPASRIYAADGSARAADPAAPAWGSGGGPSAGATAPHCGSKSAARTWGTVWSSSVSPPGENLFPHSYCGRSGSAPTGPTVPWSGGLPRPEHGRRTHQGRHAHRWDRPPLNGAWPHTHSPPGRRTASTTPQECAVRGLAVGTYSPASYDHQCCRRRLRRAGSLTSWVSITEGGLMGSGQRLRECL